MADSLDPREVVIVAAAELIALYRAVAKVVRPKSSFKKYKLIAEGDTGPLFISDRSSSES